uniref:efflux RND transporter permease subunit n=1 Tax=Prevotella heparinolytica TaxID=28113 RepID=UPI00359F4989
LNEEGDEYDINVRYAPEKRNDINSLRNIRITNMLGKQIPLYSVADIEEGYGQLEITRLAQQRYVKVMADLNGISLGEATEKIQEMLDGMDFPEGLDVEISGQVTEQEESFGSLYLMLALGIVLVYMVMAAQFESFKSPFIVMFSIPFTLVGVILAFFVTRLTLSVTTFIGVIMLIGIVVNNGIILVDYTNLLRMRNYKLKDAVMEAGRSRLRPVLMTTFTTILGMFPMALSAGMGKEMFAPLGITIIGGLLISTMFTLIVIPTIYTVFHKNLLKTEEVAADNV